MPEVTNVTMDGSVAEGLESEAHTRRRQWEPQIAAGDTDTVDEACHYYVDDEMLESRL